MPTTEIATLNLTPGSDIGDPKNAASRTVNDCCKVLAKQPGLQTLRFGPVVENPSQMQMFIEWDSKQDHENFVASEAYGPFLKDFQTVMAGPPTFMHVDFEGDVSGAYKAPVTEVASFVYNGDAPEKWTKGVHDFIAFCVRERPDMKFHGYATGVTHERDVSKDDVKGQAGVLIVGWDSIEQHMAFRKLEVFQQNAQMMRQQANAVEVHHASVMDFVAD